MAYEKQQREGLVPEYYYVQRPSNTYKDKYDEIEWQPLCKKHAKALVDGKCPICGEQQ